MHPLLPSSVIIFLMMATNRLKSIVLAFTNHDDDDTSKRATTRRRSFNLRSILSFLLMLLLLYNIVTPPPIDSSSSFIQRRHQRTTALFFQPNAAFGNSRIRLYSKHDRTLDSKARRRRIYFAALVADESRELLDLHAAESYGLYRAVALLECDRTFQGTPRQTCFQLGSDMYRYIHSGLFGNSTHVSIELWTTTE